MKKVFFLLVILIPLSLKAEDLAPRTAKTFLDDGVYLVSSPLRLTREDILPIIGVTAALGGAALLDRTVRHHLAPWSETGSTKGLRKFGDFGQLAGPIIGTGFALQGWASDNDKSKETAYLAYETFLWAGAAEIIMKPIIGRARPSVTDSPSQFKFRRSSSSFPSGHTTTAFAAATVFAEQYPKWYVVIPAYGVAGAVGYSRLAANQHWLSDVVGAAILGSVVSHVLRARHRHPSEYAWHLETSGSDLKLVRKF